MSKWVGDDKMIKSCCFNGHKLKLIVISFFRDRKGPQQPVSNQRLREGASQSARACRSPHHTHRKSLCSCQRTSRGECPFPNNDILSLKGLFWTEIKKSFCYQFFVEFYLWKTSNEVEPLFLFLQQSLALERKSLLLSWVSAIDNPNEFICSACDTMQMGRKQNI